MAAIITIAKGFNKDGGSTTSTRLASERGLAQANTFQTFTTAEIAADGSGEIKVERIFDTDSRKKELVGSIKFGRERGSSNEITAWTMRECVECDKPATTGRFCDRHFVENKL